ncbi:helix-turn-helix transcriptional regulator [Nitrobacter sp.]|uniref:helix-turn-helix domain-containing protein n=1 Tax=Nitrobacter TaxID=911 RepID=UPI00059CE6CD
MSDSAVHPLKAYRKAQGMTLEELASRVGTTKSWLSRIESGEPPGSSLIGRLVAASDGQLTPNDFFRAA